MVALDFCYRKGYCIYRNRERETQREGGETNKQINSSNVGDVARKKGINTISEFFSLDLAEKIIEESGHADAVICANVMCHIPDMNDIAQGITKLLTADGVLIFEEPYLGDMLAKTSYDQIYDEHVLRCLPLCQS